MSSLSLQPLDCVHVGVCACMCTCAHVEERGSGKERINKVQSLRVLQPSLNTSAEHSWDSTAQGTGKPQAISGFIDYSQHLNPPKPMGSLYRFPRTCVISVLKMMHLTLAVQL